MYVDLSEAILKNDQAAVARHFSLAGAPEPRISWAPSLDSIPQPEIQGLLKYWNRLRGEAPMPFHDQIDPIDLKGALGFIMILEAVEGGSDFRYRVYGSKISARSGFDMTGKLVSELASSPKMGSFFSASYRAVFSRAAPLMTVHLPPPEVSAVRWTRLILPLAGRSGGVERLLVGNLPGALGEIT